MLFILGISFFIRANLLQNKKAIASARAGNVIGGGDWSRNRIIPDTVTALMNNQPVQVRNPSAVRPWQHVLEPLFAYLSLAAAMTRDPLAYATAYNVGPDKEDVLDVETVTRKFIDYYGKGSYKAESSEQQPHEAQLLLLDNSKIKEAIGVQPKYHAEQAVQLTAEWYARKEQSAQEKCLQQIKDYFSE